MKRLLTTLSVFVVIQAASGAGSSGAASVPNDQFFSQQWALSNQGGVNQIVMIDADDFHTVPQQGVAGADIGWLDAQDEVSKLATNPVVVAVIDSGIDASHEDLIGKVAPGARDFLLGFPFVTDPDGHGTHVSGIIAANSGNGVGIAGVAPPSVKILPLRVQWAASDGNANGYSYPDPSKTVDPNHPVYTLFADFVAQAVNYAVNMGTPIINLSQYWPKIADTQNARAAVQNAVGPSHNVLVVAAAANDRKNVPTYPCSYEGVLCVGAITNTGQMAIYSNYGGIVDLLAPGDGIISTYPKADESQYLRINGYEMLSGTSQAAPMISGIAAALKSINPNIGLNEIKARLFASASAPPAPGVSLYGLVNMKRAIDAQPQPVYYPDFKAIGELPVDETSLKIQGQISVQNLWLASTGVKIQISANGKVAGSVTADSLASGDSISVPWSYQFASLDDSSDVALSVQVTDDQGTSKTFQLNASAVRSAQSIQGNQVLSIPGVNSTLPDCSNAAVPEWLCTNNGHILPNHLNSVESYPPSTGLTRFYKQVAFDNNGGTLQIYDPSNAVSPTTSVTIPGMQGIREVIRMDVKGDGNMDWVVIGVGQNPGEPVVHQSFYYLSPSFQPLFGTPLASNYEIYVTYNFQTQDALSGALNLNRSYAGVGSWIRVNGILLPAIISAGPLPEKDGFPEQDARRNQIAYHLFYLSPMAVTPPAAPSTTGVVLEIRALDNAAFRTKYPRASLQSYIPESPSDMTEGRSRILFANGTTINTPSLIWDIRSVTDTSVLAAPGWDQISANGSPYTALSPNSSTNASAFLSFFDNEHGSITWVDPNGQYQDDSEFAYLSPEDPIVGLIGTFNIPSTGRYWFLQSGFDLVGYHQSSATGSAAIETKTIPLERDSTFLTAQFSQMFNPVMVGTPANPLPGVYIDSTMVRGDQVSVAVWNNVNDDIEKPLRYSLQIPAGCMETNPVQLTSVAESFGLPLLCVPNGGGQIQLVVVKPQP